MGNKLESSKIKKLGSILHLTDLGNIIIKNPPKLPKIGADVVNEKMVHIGKVHDIFGPVTAPYVSIRVKSQFKDQITTNDVLYSLDRRRSQKSKKHQKRY